MCIRDRLSAATALRMWQAAWRIALKFRLGLQLGLRFCPDWLVMIQGPGDTPAEQSPCTNRARPRATSLIEINAILTPGIHAYGFFYLGRCFSNIFPSWSKSHEDEKMLRTKYSYSRYHNRLSITRQFLVSFRRLLTHYHRYVLFFSHLHRALRDII